MRIENEFTLEISPERLWSSLLDVERIAPCLPGAEVTEIVDDRHWKGHLNVKFGPVAMRFAGSVAMVDRDDDAHRVVLEAQGRESRGKGAASATVTSWLEPAADSTTIRMVADITLQGLVAQVARGMLPDIAAKLTDEFAGCLRATMASGAKPASASPSEADVASAPADVATGTSAVPPARVEPGRPPAHLPDAAPRSVGVLRLAASALLSALRRAIARLMARRSPR
jgi:uncharacterized protein